MGNIITRSWRGHRAEPIKGKYVSVKKKGRQKRDVARGSIDNGEKGSSIPNALPSNNYRRIGGILESVLDSEPTR
jgi:hypothetical protein